MPTYDEYVQQRSRELQRKLQEARAKDQEAARANESKSTGKHAKK